VRDAGCRDPARLAGVLPAGARCDGAIYGHHLGCGRFTGHQHAHLSRDINHLFGDVRSPLDRHIRDIGGIGGRLRGYLDHRGRGARRHSHH
jgi:hypothetical protein